MKGRIHSFQSLGTVDGPGVRAVVFLQGCPLRCICCHNPDTWDPAGGEEADSAALAQKILRYRSYFGDKGGVTVSGGEPLLQSGFVYALFAELKTRGVHTALDTAGCVRSDEEDKLLSVTDLVLLDHKYGTEEDYRLYTRGSLKTTEEFLEALDQRGIPTWLRRVIIPGKNDDPESVAALNDAARRFSCVKKIELLPLRNFCEEKYKALRIPFPLAGTPMPSKETMASLEGLIDEAFR